MMIGIDNARTPPRRAKLRNVMANALPSKNAQRSTPNAQRSIEGASCRWLFLVSTPGNLLAGRSLDAGCENADEFDTFVDQGIDTAGPFFEKSSSGQTQ